MPVVVGAIVQYQSDCESHIAKMKMITLVMITQQSDGVVF